ncbi:MAG: NRDE family protein, partial [Gammaproteobacteria bacterium]|nr:NRDE family protein [Gammaproteobacteria bacterium]
MCIVFLAIDQHPDYPLIIAANRDEYHDRPSASMGFWEDHPQILAGRDLRESGTWLGLTRSGYFCTVTNYPDKSTPTQELNSRGQLVRQFLVDEPPASRSRRHLKNMGQTYRPFNLVFGNYPDLYTYSNCEQEFTRLGKGYHSVSNGPMNQAWEKVSHGVRKLTD